MHRDGYEYEQFVNKFLKGEIVSGHEDCFDIEGLKALYEVKGVKAFIKDNQGYTAMGKYQIDLEHHRGLLDAAKEKRKKAKYVFVLKLSNRKIWRTVSWEAVELGFQKKEFITFKRRDNQREIFQIPMIKIW